ncbi:uncharacterized protein At1g01500-like isoform X2 [Diospyros lotus]|uniref:uncharacterized protein At1g01500-like isoform X2 n=1 Tax=Diospyros lotus TaxID=55363 RepID=UPI00225A9A7F|nr:uncharacterized protein At1g01500-like isoform X2 [Diospyros lotus]
MEDSHKLVNRNGLPENSHYLTRHSYQQSAKVSLPWLDLKVFYLRVTNCEIDDSAPEHLRLKHFPLNHDTLLEINGVRTSIYSDGVSSILRRDRLDKKSEEVTFVCTDSIRVSGSVKFEVFDRDVLLLSGVLDFCAKNGYIGQSENHSQTWSMNCESDIVADTGFLRGKPYMNLELASPRIEVYVTGCFAGTPIILTKTVQLNLQKKQMRKKMLNSRPENGAAESLEDAPSSLATQLLPKSFILLQQSLHCTKCLML